VSSNTSRPVEHAEQLRLLQRAVRQAEEFRFIVVQHNDRPAALAAVERELRQRWPERALLRLQTQQEDYYSLVRRIEQHRGFVLLDDFEHLAENPELYTGFNQRRDYLSTLPVQLLAFVFDDEDHFNIAACKEHLRDLWSIRNLVVELVGKERPKTGSPRMKPLEIEVLSNSASWMRERADFLMENRAYLTVNDLMAERVGFKKNRDQTYQYLSGNQLHSFNVNMDEVEDILDSLISEIRTNPNLGLQRKSVSEIRNLANQLRATASLLW
jgi:hypothetical protein